VPDGSEEDRDAQPEASGAEPLSPQLEKVVSEHRRQWSRDLLIGAVISGCVVVTLILMGANYQSNEWGAEPRFSWLWSLVPIAILVITLTVLAVREADRKAEFREKKIDERIENEARTAESDQHFESGLKLNRSLLKRYHDLSTQQARASFRLAHYVMIATAVLLIGGAVAAVAAPNTSASVTIASLAGLASALSGYISSTLIKSYQVAVQQAQVYFREPLAGGYLLSAERLASDLTGADQAQAMQQVIGGLVQAAVGVAQSDQGLQQDGQTDTGAPSRQLSA
jgi:hypothetical protein